MKKKCFGSYLAVHARETLVERKNEKKEKKNNAALHQNEERNYKQ